MNQGGVPVQFGVEQVFLASAFGSPHTGHDQPLFTGDPRDSDLRQS